MTIFRTKAYVKVTQASTLLLCNTVSSVEYACHIWIYIFYGTKVKANVQVFCDELTVF